MMCEVIPLIGTILIFPIGGVFLIIAYLVFDELKHKFFGETRKDLSKKLERADGIISTTHEQYCVLCDEIEDYKKKVSELQQKVFDLSDDRANLLNKLEEK